MSLLKQIWITLAVLLALFVASWVYYMPSGDQRGAWRNETGGTVLSISEFQASMYSETAVSCLHQLSFPAHMKLVEWLEGATVARDGAQLVLTIDGVLEPMRLNRIDALPAECTRPDPTTATPRAVFDVMWHAMNDHYAFFDLHGVDWAARQALRPAEDAVMSDEALFALLAQALAGFDDGHLQLGTSVGAFSPAVRPDWVPDGMTRTDLVRLAHDTVGADLVAVDLTGVHYALLPDGIGYVSIRHMDIETPIGAKSGGAMALAFAEVAEALAPARAIVLDLRYNPGGSDTVSFGVAGHFIDEVLPVFTKTTRMGDGQSEPFTAAVRPFDDTPLNQPVIVLTSQATGSAAEILTLALREMPQVTTMGQPTGGGLSDVMGVKLPNGWDLGLSHQTYLTMDGTSFEAVGIPPDVVFEIDGAALARGEDTLLRTAFERARQN